MMAETTGVVTLIPENIPDELAERPQWVCWRYETRDGKPTKVPYTPESGQRASTTDLMTWRTLEDALGCLEADTAELLRLPHYDGVGFVLSSGDPFVGVDLDACRNPETGEIAEWAQKIIDRVQDGYIEVSPSGTGIHIIVKGTVRGSGKTQRRVESGKIEMYSRERFLTITGELP
jgi:primase-polymerase (primpol)-like protein